jgi:transposase-like protein
MSPEECHIVAVGKRRDGGTRYWCLEHRADATAKYGRRADKCRHADIPTIMPNQVLDLDVDAFRGGVAMWGAVAPIYDTTKTPIEQGVHVHARRIPGGSKEIDDTFRRVRAVHRQGKQVREIVISELEAVYYMVSSVLGFAMKFVCCPLCGLPHLDKDWFSVHPHRRHLCAGCGKHFRDTERSIGNPIAAVSATFPRRRPLTPAKKVIEIDQSKYPGGIQIWGSNPALVWTARRSEEEGIHLHVFGEDGTSTILDDTYLRVTIDGVPIDDAMIRILMAQSALPHLAARVLSVSCPKCRHPHFDTGVQAFTPHEKHSCASCGSTFRSVGRMRKTIGNPMLGMFVKLGRNARQPPRQHPSRLLVETI